MSPEEQAGFALLLLPQISSGNMEYWWYTESPNSTPRQIYTSTQKYNADARQLRSLHDELGLRPSFLVLPLWPETFECSAKAKALEGTDNKAASYDGPEPVEVKVTFLLEDVEDRLRNFEQFVVDSKMLRLYSAEPANEEMRFANSNVVERVVQFLSLSVGSMYFRPAGVEGKSVGEPRQACFLLSAGVFRMMCYLVDLSVEEQLWSWDGHLLRASVSMTMAEAITALSSQPKNVLILSEGKLGTLVDAANPPEELRTLDKQHQEAAIKAIQEQENQTQSDVTGARVRALVPGDVEKLERSLPKPTAGETAKLDLKKALIQKELWGGGDLP